MTIDTAPSDLDVKPWQREIHGIFGDAGLRHVVYVPDAGHKGLITLVQDDPAMVTTPLTTEEEGIGLLAGAWLGGDKGALLMQSSGVGNCINMLGLQQSCRFPLFMLVTMRGEWNEFNPWQEPMSRATVPSLEAMGCLVKRADEPAAVAEAVKAGLDLAFGGDQAVAVLLGQKLIGRKVWTEEPGEDPAAQTGEEGGS